MKAVLWVDQLAALLGGMLAVLAAWVECNERSGSNGVLSLRFHYDYQNICGLVAPYKSRVYEVMMFGKYGYEKEQYKQDN